MQINQFNDPNQKWEVEEFKGSASILITFPEELCISAYGIKCCGENPGANPIQWVVKGDDEVIGIVSAKETFDEPYQIMQWKVKRNKYTTIEFQFSKTLGG